MKFLDQEKRRQLLKTSAILARCLIAIMSFLAKN